MRSCTTRRARPGCPAPRRAPGRRATRASSSSGRRRRRGAQEQLDRGQGLGEGVVDVARQARPLVGDGAIALGLGEVAPDLAQLVERALARLGLADERLDAEHDADGDAGAEQRDRARTRSSAPAAACTTQPLDDGEDGRDDDGDDPARAARARASAASISGKAIHSAAGESHSRTTQGPPERGDPRGVRPPGPAGRSTAGRAPARVRRPADVDARGARRRRPPTATPRPGDGGTTARRRAAASRTSRPQDQPRASPTACGSADHAVHGSRARRPPHRPKGGSPGSTLRRRRIPRGIRDVDGPVGRGGWRQSPHPSTLEVLRVRRPARPAPRPRPLRPHVRGDRAHHLPGHVPRRRLTAGLARESTSAVTDLPADHLAFAMPAAGDAPEFTASRVDADQWEGWARRARGWRRRSRSASRPPARPEAARRLASRRSACADGSGLVPGGTATSTPGTVVLTPARPTPWTPRSARPCRWAAASSRSPPPSDADESFSHTPVVWTTLDDWQAVGARGVPGTGRPSRPSSRCATSDAVADAGPRRRRRPRSARRRSRRRTRARRCRRSPGRTRPLTTMQAFLLAISALVVGAFFTVWTISRAGGRRGAQGARRLDRATCCATRSGRPPCCWSAASAVGDGLARRRGDARCPTSSRSSSTPGDDACAAPPPWCVLGLARRRASVASPASPGSTRTPPLAAPLTRNPPRQEDPMDLHLDHITLVYPDGDGDAHGRRRRRPRRPRRDDDRPARAVRAPGSPACSPCAAGLTGPTIGRGSGIGGDVVFTPTTCGRRAATRARLRRASAWCSSRRSCCGIAHRPGAAGAARPPARPAPDGACERAAWSCSTPWASRTSAPTARAAVRRPAAARRDRARPRRAARGAARRRADVRARPRARHAGGGADHRAGARDGRGNPVGLDDASTLATVDDTVRMLDARLEGPQHHVGAGCDALTWLVGRPRCGSHGLAAGATSGRQRGNGIQFLSIQFG